jgi:hypothetical protein
MSKIITVNDINKTKFYQLPKAFFHNPLYMDMKNESKIAYSILRDLLDLSIKNNWINEKNEVYVKLSREKLMKYLHIKGSQKMTEVMKTLINKELIVERQVGLNICNEIYVCIPDELNDIYSDEELLEMSDEIRSFENQKSEECDKTRTFENQNSKVLKIKSQKIRKSKVKSFENQRHTNTNSTNTNSTTCSSSSNEINLIEEFEANICKLRKTPSIKFNRLIKSYPADFILAIIEECTTVVSYNGFEKAFVSYLKRNCKTKEDVMLASQKFREERDNRYKKSKPKKDGDQPKTNFHNFEGREYD